MDLHRPLCETLQLQPQAIARLQLQSFRIESVRMRAIDDRSSLSETGLFRSFCRHQIGDRMGKAHPLKDA